MPLWGAWRVKQRRSFPQHTMSNHTDGRTVKKEVCKEIETPYEQKGNRDYQQQPQRREQLAVTTLKEQQKRRRSTVTKQ